MENLISIPVPLPLFPPPIGGVGKPGKLELSRIVPKREKRGKREPVFFSGISCKEAIFLVTNVINRRLNTRASWGLALAPIHVISKLVQSTRVCVMEFGLYELIYQYARARARVMGYGG